MKIAVVGTGYVGLVTGTCFAESGNDVTCVDIDQAEDRPAQRGRDCRSTSRAWPKWSSATPTAERLHFTTDLAAAVRAAKLVFLAVGTPPARRRLGRSVEPCGAWSTAWPRTCATTPSWSPRARCRWARTPRSSRGSRSAPAAMCDVASNPEFLKEGAAIDDFMKPDRVVVGVRRAGSRPTCCASCTQPFLRTEKPFLVMSPESAEMTKYVANALLATKISFINEMANLCERMRRRHQRRPPRHRPRQPHRLRVPVSRRRLRRQLLPQGRAGAGGDGRGARRRAAHAGGRRRGQRASEDGPAAKRSSSTSAASWRARRSPSGAWRSSRGPTTSAKRRRWC